MTLLLESALRSLLFGLLVWALLKSLRIRDVGTQTAIWTFVLLIALAMPLMSRYLPRLPLMLPHPAPAAAIPTHSATDRGAMTPQVLWLARNGQQLLIAVYLAGLLTCLSRLALGLILAVRLYLDAKPIQAGWAFGQRLRISPTLKSPASLANTILLPADFETWSAFRLEAVLAHEAAHIARRDFFVQLAASFHCAVFWFSPFAWWLQRKLAEIAEVASDEAAIVRMRDRLRYAQVLIDIARQLHSRPMIVAMAKGQLIAHRIDRILSDERHGHASASVRVLVMTGVGIAALAVAAASQAVAEYPFSPLQLLHVTAARSAARPARAARRIGVSTHRRVPPGDATPAPAAQTVSDHPTPSYDPRALLNSVYIARPAYPPASTIVHEGRTFYIISTERPIAEDAVTNGTEVYGK